MRPCRRCGVSFVGVNRQPSLNAGRGRGLLHGSALVAYRDRQGSADGASGSDEEIDQMGEEFSIHPLALEDCHHQHQRPKVDQYQQHLLLVAYGTEAAIQGEPTRLHELDLVAGENFLVTFHQVPPIDAPAVAKRIQAHPELAHHGAGFLLYVVLDELVDSFVPTMDRIGERVEDLGEDVFAGRQVQNDVFALRRDLVTIRRVMGPMAMP
jgi:magnesium transporter